MPERKVECRMNRPASYKQPFFRAWLLSVVSLFSLLPRGVNSVAKHLSERPLFSISGEDLSSESSMARAIDFAISPDKIKMAIEFVVSNADSTIGIRLGEWELNTKRRIANIELDNRVPPDSIFASLSHPTIQYTPNGSGIIARIENRLYSLDSEDLRLKYSISSTPSPEQLASEQAYRFFSISSNGNSLVALFAQSYDPQRLGSIHCYKTETGEELSEWPLSTLAQSLSVSPDGSRILVTILNPRDATDI